MKTPKRISASSSPLASPSSQQRPHGSRPASAPESANRHANGHRPRSPDAPHTAPLQRANIAHTRSHPRRGHARRLASALDDALTVELSTIAGVVSGWLDHPLTEAGDPQAVAGRRLALPEGDRHEELRRLGYNTQLTWPCSAPNSDARVPCHRMRDRRLPWVVRPRRVGRHGVGDLHARSAVSPAAPCWHPARLSAIGPWSTPLALVQPKWPSDVGCVRLERPNLVGNDRAVSVGQWPRERIRKPLPG